MSGDRKHNADYTVVGMAECEMTKAIAAIALLAALATLTGCGELQQSSAKAAATSKPQKAQSRGTAHRFTLTKLNGGVAFDTQTGQICRTWD